jgi:hypothetical protein
MADKLWSMFSPIHSRLHGPTSHKTKKGLRILVQTTGKGSRAGMWRERGKAASAGLDLEDVKLGHIGCG